VAISGFDWDDDNTLHIERHQFTPDEVEEVFADPCGHGPRYGGQGAAIVPPQI